METRTLTGYLGSDLEIRTLPERSELRERTAVAPLEQLDHVEAGRRADDRRDLARARYRCLEEIESVRYSLKDLEYAGSHLKWLTGGGRQLVKHLRDALTCMERGIQEYELEVGRSSFGSALRRHRAELAQAREALSLM